ncbi:hypothetical protein [Anaeromyxobacter sp. Fw109-5]|uniref:hypothetical protein n=1 Tax=Anaeromyxobacter sp. (strain Fw109-5) TaxID=404589 RepID=UPI00031DEB43|nr:hypothetical protein [Anaeromyxobacter sp. Fw109-5]
MHTTIKAALLAAGVLFLGAMLRLQHRTFAERATRAPALLEATAAADRPAGRLSPLAMSSGPGSSPLASRSAPR